MGWFYLLIWRSSSERKSNHTNQFFILHVVLGTVSWSPSIQSGNKVSCSIDVSDDTCYERTLWVKDQLLCFIGGQGCGDQTLLGRMKGQRCCTNLAKGNHAICTHVTLPRLKRHCSLSSGLYVRLHHAPKDQ